MFVLNVAACVVVDVAVAAAAAAAKCDCMLSKVLISIIVPCC